MACHGATDLSRIDILPSDDQREITDGLARALDDLPVGAADAAAVAALGFVGAALPADAGGLGLDIADEALINIELGRRLAGLEILAANLAARLVANDRELVGALIEGRRIAGFAAPVAGWTADAAGPRGEVHLIGRGEVFLALSPQGAALLGSDDLAPAQTAEAMDAIAPVARSAVLTGRQPLWREADGAPIWTLAVLSIAAQLVGVAQAARDMGVEYAKTRVQFDKPIGAFQGVAHQLADCAVRAEAAHDQTLFAAIALRDGSPAAAFHVTAAILTAMDAAFRNATTNIQVHGAMGFAALSGAHLFLRRAVVLRHLAGGVRLHERAMLEADAPGG